MDGQTFGFVNVTVRDNGIPEGEKTFQVRVINQVLPGPFVSLMTVICVRLINYPSFILGVSFCLFFIFHPDTHCQDVDTMLE